MKSNEQRIVSWLVGLLASSGLALLAVSCSSADEPARAPSVEDFDLTSIPADVATLEAANIEYSKAYRVDRNHPAVKARKEQLNGINDGLANVLATVEIEPGHVVKFYEPEPGARLVSETYADDQRRVLKGVAAGSLVEVYKALRPNTEPPAVLVDADARAADPTLAAPPPADLDQAPPERGSLETEKTDKHGTSSCTHFRNDHGGCPVGAAGDSLFCFCNNVGVTRAFSHTASHSAWLVASFVGSVSFRLSYSGGVMGIWAIDQGENFGIQLMSGSGKGRHPSCDGCVWLNTCNSYFQCLRDHRGDVIAVEAGESYHFGGCTENDQTPTPPAGWSCF